MSFAEARSTSQRLLSRHLQKRKLPIRSQRNFTLQEGCKRKVSEMRRSGEVSTTLPFPAFHRQTRGCRRQASKALQTLRQHTFSTGLHPLPHFPMASTMHSARRTFAFSKLFMNTKWVSLVPESFLSSNFCSFT